MPGPPVMDHKQIKNKTGNERKAYNVSIINDFLPENTADQNINSQYVF
jgi:hypothetical protein